MSTSSQAASAVERIESASALKRGIEVWYAAFGGIAMWTLHFMYLVSAEHWTYLHNYGWTLHTATVITALGTVAAIWLSVRLLRMSADADPSSNSDAGQLHFLAHLGILVGTISLMLILLEGFYVLVIPHG